MDYRVKGMMFRSASGRATVVALVAGGVVAVSGCANRDDLITSASTAGTTAYLIHEDQEDDFARARDFASDNIAALRRDAARGEGENLRAFAALLGQQDASAFGEWMQTHYATLFGGSTTADELVSRVWVMRGETALAVDETG